MNHDDDLYQVQLLEEGMKPAHKGKITKWTHHAHFGNASCGDAYDVYLLIEDGVVSDAGWIGDGCLVSNASMSVLMKELCGKSISEIENMDYQHILTVLHLESVTSSRIGCVKTPLTTVQKAIRSLE